MCKCLCLCKTVSAEEQCWACMHGLKVRLPLVRVKVLLNGKSCTLDAHFHVLIIIIIIMDISVAHDP